MQVTISLEFPTIDGIPWTKTHGKFKSKFYSQIRY